MVSASEERIARVRDALSTVIAELTLSTPGLTAAEVRAAMTPIRISVSGQAQDREPVHVEAWLVARERGVAVGVGGFLSVDDCDAIADAATSATLDRIAMWGSSGGVGEGG